LTSLVSSFASRALVLQLEIFPKNGASQAFGTGFALTKAKPVLPHSPGFSAARNWENVVKMFPIAFLLELQARLYTP